MTILFHCANLIIFVLFLVAAILQLNDPDPWRWVAIYGAAAAACVSDARAWPRRTLGIAGVLFVAVIWMAIVGHQAWGETSVGQLFQPMENYEGGPIELGREAAGLAIIAVWMVVLLLRWRQTGQKRH